jgi:hypothetical protein
MICDKLLVVTFWNLGSCNIAQPGVARPAQRSRGDNLHSDAIGVTYSPPESPLSGLTAVALRELLYLLLQAMLCDEFHCDSFAARLATRRYARQRWRSKSSEGRMIEAFSRKWTTNPSERMRRISMGVRRSQDPASKSLKLASRVANLAATRLWFFFLLLTFVACDQSPKSAEAEQSAPAPVEAPAPSAPEPAPEAFSPEKRLGAGKISDWRVADKDVRIRAANEFNLIFERTSPPDHELSRVERAVKAIALDRCLMETTKEPAMQEQSVASTAALCLVMMDAR